MESHSLFGKELNIIWEVGAKHALYREDGKWYHQLQEFPGALFDANGYFIFNTKDEYLKSPFLQIKRDIHIPSGISSIPGYVRISEGSNLLLISQGIVSISEGNSSYQTTQVPLGNETPERNSSPRERIIRDTEVGKWVKRLYQYRCQICGYVTELNHGVFYAESHHIKPLGEKHNGPDVVENILCVCPNHHVLLDYGGIQIDLTKICMINKHEINIEYINYHNFIIFKGLKEQM
jgi:5-methylcytosine-specific restriction enzyme A